MDIVYVGYTISTKGLGSTRSSKELMLLRIIFDIEVKSITVIFILGIT